MSTPGIFNWHRESSENRRCAEEKLKIDSFALFFLSVVNSTWVTVNFKAESHFKAAYCTVVWVKVKSTLHLPFSFSCESLLKVCIEPSPECAGLLFLRCSAISYSPENNGGRIKMQEKRNTVSGPYFQNKT